MTMSVRTSPSPVSVNREESYLHFLARESRVALRWAVIISAAATALLLMLAFLPGAILAALVLLVAYALLLAAHAIEQRTHRLGDPDEEVSLEIEAAAAALVPEEEIERHEITDAVHQRRFKLTVGIILSVAALAVVVAALLFGSQFIALGALLVFSYMLLVAAPLWLGWVEDEAEEESHRVEEQLNEPT